MDTLGLAVVGSAGVIGDDHVREICSLESARLVGVTDVNDEAALQQARQVGARFYPTMENLLEDPAVDAVTIAVPHPLHATLAIQALQAGKHVLTEKPMAVTPSQADGMVLAAREAGLKLGVIMNCRIESGPSRMRAIVREDGLGEIYQTTLVHAAFRTQHYYDSASWRGTWSGEGGGVLLNQSIHYLDILQWLAGMPERVHGIASTISHRIEVEDFASALLEYGSGAHGVVHCSTVQAPRQKHLELWGDRGGLVLQGDRLTYHNYHGLEMSLRESPEEEIGLFSERAWRAESFEMGPDSSAHQKAIDDFARAVLEDREPAVPGEEGLKSLELAAAIILSSCRRQTVELPVDRRAYDDLMDELKELQSLTRPGDPDLT